MLILSFHLRMLVAVGWILLAAALEADSNVVDSQAGIVLKRSGILGMKTKNTMMSLFVKIQSPKVNKYNSSCKKTCNNQGCLLKESQLEKLLTSTLDNQINQVWDDKQVIFNTLINASQTEANSPGVEKKKKRSAILAFLGGSITGILAFGYNIYQNHKINSHLDTLEGSFQDFKNEIYDFQSSTLEFEKSTLKVIQDLQKNEFEELNELFCENKQIAAGILKTLEVGNFENRLKEAFKSTSKGTLTQLLNPALVNSKNLKQLVAQHPAFKNTIYELQPLYLYSTVSMTLLEIAKVSDLSYDFHYLLDIPLIKKNQIYELYSLETVPIVHLNKCLQFDMPQAVYKDKNAYYSVDASNCETTDQMHLCPQSTFQNTREIPCFKNKMNTCKVKEAKCDTQEIFLESGILISTKEPVYVTGRKDKYKILKPLQMPDSGVRFLKYKDYALIQYGNEIIRSPNTTVIEIDYKPQFTEQWASFLNESVRNLQRVDTSHLFDIMDKQEMEHDLLKKQLHHHSHYNDWTFILALFATLMWGLVLSVHFFFTVKGYLKRFNKKRQHEKELFEEFKKFREAKRVKAWNPAIKKKNLKWEKLPSAPAIEVGSQEAESSKDGMQQKEAMIVPDKVETKPKATGLYFIDDKIMFKPSSNSDSSSDDENMRKSIALYERALSD